MKLIKDVEELEQKMMENSNQKIKQFVGELNELSIGEGFTIDNIELLMTKYNQEAKQDLLESVNDLVSHYDETKIIKEKKD